MISRNRGIAHAHKTPTRNTPDREGVVVQCERGATG